MGLPAAGAILRDALFRGADDAILVTDQRCAASDTLATSYILSCAVRKLDYDIVLCGRQAIDGDTAQVGPQLAEKLGIPQITYVEKLLGLNGKTITAQRNIGNGWQQVKAGLPILLTVVGEANEPRVAAAKKLMRYKNALTPVEIKAAAQGPKPRCRRADAFAIGRKKMRNAERKGSADKAVGPRFCEGGFDVVRQERLTYESSSHTERCSYGQGKQKCRTYGRRHRGNDTRTNQR